MAPFERLYIAQYCANRWPQGGYQLGYNLGPIPERIVKEMGYDRAAATFAGCRPEVDAVKFFPDGLLLIEAKVFKVLEGMRSLLGYGHLVGSTVELQPWWGKPVTLRLVTTRTTDILEAQAKAYGVQVDVYQTPEVMEQAAKYERYWGTEYQRERQLRKARMRELGLD